MKIKNIPQENVQLLITEGGGEELILSNLCHFSGCDIPHQKRNVTIVILH